MARKLHISSPGFSGKERAVNVAMIITEKERQELEQAVRELKFRMQTGEEFFSLMEFVRLKTDEMMYLMPRMQMDIDDELVASFYLKIRKHCDRVVLSYSADGGSKTYVSYLKNFINFQLISFRQREQLRMQKEYVLNAISLEERHNTYGEYYKASVFEQGEKIQDEEVREVYEYIVTYPNPDGALITDRTKRSRLLLYIFSHYDSLTQNMQQKLASLYAVEAGLFSFISTYLEEEKRRRITPRMEHREKMMSRYWLRYVVLLDSLENEPDEEKRNELLYQSSRTLQLLRHHQSASDVRTCHGMSYRRIADVVGYSLSRTGYNITKAKDLITELFNDEGLDRA